MPKTRSISPGSTLTICTISWLPSAVSIQFKEGSQGIRNVTLEKEFDEDKDQELKTLLRQASLSNYLVILRSVSGILIQSRPKVNSLSVDGSLGILQAPSTQPYSKRALVNRYRFFNFTVLMGWFSMLIVLLIGLYGISMLTQLQTPTKFEVVQTQK
jgi:hypothetical protein